MSNQPPLPPVPGQGPYGVPQGYPPAQGYAMPPQGYGQPYPGGPMPQPQQSNGWALAALITSLVGGCLPFLGGLLAVVFGFLGMRRAGTTGTGKGMAIAGMIIGVLSIVGWTVFGGAALALFKGTEANRELNRQFITELQAGNADKAAALTDSTVITADEMAGAVTFFKGLAKVTDITAVNVNAQSNSSGSSVEVASVITFADGKTATMTTRQAKINDQWKIRMFQVGKPQ